MEIMQWGSLGIGYTIQSNRAEYEHLEDWCIENFGVRRGPLDDGYRWGVELMGRIINDLVIANFHFKNIDDALAFKLRWI